MDWLNGISLTSLGLPVWAVVVLVLGTFLATKGVDGVLKIWAFVFDREKYYDLQEKSAEEALVTELKDRIDKLEKVVEQQEVRYSQAIAAANAKHEESRAAHVKCELQNAELRGEVNLLKDKVARLEQHDKNNIDNVKALKAAVIEDDPNKATKLPP